MSVSDADPRFNTVALSTVASISSPSVLPKRSAMTCAVWASGNCSSKVGLAAFID